MNRPAHRPKLSPADRARIRMLKEEAKWRRLMRLVEQRLRDLEDARRAMEGEVYYPPDVARNHSTHWECAELCRINATRPASRICFTLPLAAYEQDRLERYMPLEPGRGHAL